MKTDQIKLSIIWLNAYSLRSPQILWLHSAHTQILFLFIWKSKIPTTEKKVKMIIRNLSIIQCRFVKSFFLRRNVQTEKNSQIEKKKRQKWTSILQWNGTN